MTEHDIRAEMMGRTVENVLHEVDQCNGVDRITLQLQLRHHYNTGRPEWFSVTFEGRRTRGVHMIARSEQT